METFPASIAYGKLNQRHASYDASRWEILELLFQGGGALLKSPRLSEVLPRHRQELDVVYQKRLDAAVYYPWASSIIGATISGIFSDPLVVGFEDPPDFYAEFLADVSKSTKKSKQAINSFFAEQLVRAMVKGAAWIQVDLPPVEGQFASKLDEEKAQADRAYLIAHDRSAVIDWEMDENEDLSFVMLRQCFNRRNGIDSTRANVTERFTYFNKQGWAVYEVTYEPKDKPKDEKMIERTREGVHSFGVVPFVHFCLPQQLWAMDKMDSACRAHLRDSNALEWGTTHSLMPELYEFLASEYGAMGAPVSEVQNDPNRAKNQSRGPGWAQVRSEKDRAEYIGPKSDSYDFAMKLIDGHRDEMHRVSHQITLSADVETGTIRRSAESKAVEADISEQLYREYGRIVKENIENTLEIVRLGRGEGPETFEGLKITGCQTFNKRTTTNHLENALVVQQMAIESPTLDRALKLDVARVHLGEVLDEDDFEKIEEELERNISDELVTPEPPGSMEEDDEEPSGGEDDTIPYEEAE